MPNFGNCNSGDDAGCAKQFVYLRKSAASVRKLRVR
jgi:hypothetical protein